MTATSSARLAFAAGLVASVAAAQDAPPALSVNYACAGGAVLQVAYLNVDPQTSLAVVGWGGALVPMRAGPTGSGVRYVAYEGDLVWHNKGNAGALLANDGATETVLLADCAALEG